MSSFKFSVFMVSKYYLQSHNVESLFIFTLWSCKLLPNMFVLFIYNISFIFHLYLHKTLFADFSMILDLVFHVYALVSIALGVSYGFKAQKADAYVTEAIPTIADALGENGTDYTPTLEGDTPIVQRTLTVARKKSFYGCAMPMSIFVNGKEVGHLKNGESQVITVNSTAFELSVQMSGGMCIGSTMVSEGTTALTYQAAIKSGMMTSHIELTQMPTLE